MILYDTKNGRFELTVRLVFFGKLMAGQDSTNKRSKIRIPTNNSRRESEADVIVDHDARNASPNLHRLVSAFRSCGHKYARTNPVPMPHQTP